MKRNSRTLKIKQIHELKQKQKINIKTYRLLRSVI